MKIVIVRRISQVFFFVVFLWFCIVSSLGTEWWQLRGWPVNWFLQLDPLVALGTVLTTGTLYSGLSWALAVLVLTVLFGRFFCGWVCPFGSIHHFVGYLGRRGKPLSRSLELNRPHAGQAVKYYVLLFLLCAASGVLAARILRLVFDTPPIFLALAAVTIVAAGLTVRGLHSNRRKAYGIFLLMLGFWTAAAFVIPLEQVIRSSLQSGLLDPIPLVYRSVNLVLLPLLDSSTRTLFVGQRYYEGAWLIGAVFLVAVLLNLKTPRFYCRYVCPLGALYGVLARLSLWKIGRVADECTNCRLCEANCEGACEPAGRIRVPECVLCMNCLDECRHDVIAYRTAPSASGEVLVPDMSRRGFVLAGVSGLAAIPLVRLGGGMSHSWNPEVIRPPGALSEADFIARCLKCGQCMRVCPTNVVQPCGLQAGLEGLWTPVLDFRIGTSGCQYNCTACSHVCPTAALRPISLDEKLGRGGFAGKGPIRIGTAFVDHGRCLPWAMDKPCIVCQENCPVSPKAIFVREHFATVRDGVVEVKSAEPLSIRVGGTVLKPGKYAAGDHYLKVSSEPGHQRRRIVANGEDTVSLSPEHRFAELPAAGTRVEIQVRLQRPQVDLERCTGCGVCEHECPVTGRRAIRVTAENESRTRKKSLLL